jgi:hypothetical protein
VFSVSIKDDFPDNDRLITEVVWAGAEQVLIRETNRESDLLRMILIDVTTRTGKVVRELNVAELDGGWFEVVCHKAMPCSGAYSDLSSRNIQDISPQIRKRAERNPDILTL